MTPQQLKDRFRRDVDDVPPDPDDTSGCLWADEEIYDIMDEVQKHFVHETLYLYGVQEIFFIAGDTSVPVPQRIIEIRGPVLLKDAGTKVAVGSIWDTTSTDDYGVPLTQPLHVPTGHGAHVSAVSLDISTNQLHLTPTPTEADVLLVPCYMEARDIEPRSDRMDVSNTRHQRVLLDGMKAVAYRKQDSDVYDPNQAERWQFRFDQQIAEVASELVRRRRNPPVMQYGGL